MNQKSHKNWTNIDKMEFIFNPKFHTFLFQVFQANKHNFILYRG